MVHESSQSRLGPILASVIAFGSAGAASAGPLAPPPIVEFAVPTASSAPIAITAGPDGNLWFTEEAGNKIGRISPSGAISEFPLAVGAMPGGIVAGPDGNLWFTERGANKIGRISPTGDLVEFSIPTAACNPLRIARGGDGNLWFTEEQANKIGRIAPDGSITEFSRTNPGSQPTGIAAGPDGNVWFTVLSPACIGLPIGCAPTEPPWIGRITPTGTITEFPLTWGSRPFGIAAGPDGNLWFTESGAGFIGRITPSGTVTEFAIPRRSNIFPGLPGEIAVGPDGNLWFTYLGDTNTIGRVSITGSITVFPGPSPYNTPCYLTTDMDGSTLYVISPCAQGLAIGADGNLWFTEPHDNNVAVLHVGAAPITHLVWRHTGTGDVDVWSLSGTHVQSATRLASGVPLEWQVVGMGDLDFNGVPDLVWRNSRIGDVAAWLIRGTAVSQSAIVSPAVTPDWQIAGVGDIDGDGTADLIWRNQQSGAVDAWLIEDGRILSAIYGIGVISSSLPLTWDLAGVADVDGDGYADWSGGAGIPEMWQCG